MAIVVFFINKWWFRANKTTGFSKKYWLNHNLPELLMTLLLNWMCMILLGTEDVTNALSNLPDWISWIYFFGKPGLAVLLGLGFTWAIYELIRKKKLDIKKHYPQNS